MCPCNDIFSCFSRSRGLKVRGPIVNSHKSRKGNKNLHAISLPSSPLVSLKQDTGGLNLTLA